MAYEIVGRKIGDDYQVVVKLLNDRKVELGREGETVKPEEAGEACDRCIAALVARFPE